MKLHLSYNLDVFDCDALQVSRAMQQITLLLIDFKAETDSRRDKNTTLEFAVELYIIALKIQLDLGGLTLKSF